MDREHPEKFEHSDPTAPEHMRDEWHDHSAEIELPAQWPGYCEPDWMAAVRHMWGFNRDPDIARARYQVSVALLACGKLYIKKGDFPDAQQLFNEALQYFSAYQLARSAREFVQNLIDDVFGEFDGFGTPTASQAKQSSQEAQLLGFAPEHCYVVSNGFVLARSSASPAGQLSAINYADKLINDQHKLIELDATWQVDDEVEEISVYKLTATSLARIHTARRSQEQAEE
jgi:hypothetical protein